MDSPPADTAVTTYRFRPRLIGAEHIFSLTPDAIDFEASNRRQRIAYRDIARIRLGYRPANMTFHRFITEIWPHDGKKLVIVSVSASGPFNFENKGAAYRTFLMEFFRRVETVQPGLQIEAGMARWRWLPAAIFGIATIAALGYVLARALIDAQFGFFVFCLGFGVLFIAQIGTMLLRNRPRICKINSIPTQVMPSS